MSRVVVRAVAGVLSWTPELDHRPGRAIGYGAWAGWQFPPPYRARQNLAPAAPRVPPAAHPAPAIEAAAFARPGAGKPRASAARPVLAASRFWSQMLLMTFLPIALAYAVGRAGGYSPGDRIGYNLGLAGGIAMLLLLLYPLRKHVRALRNWGAVKHWFLAHMALGLGGPV